MSYEYPYKAGFISSLPDRDFADYLNTRDSLLVQCGIYFVRTPLTLSGAAPGKYPIPKDDIVKTLNPEIAKDYLDSCVSKILKTAQENIVQAYSEYAIFDDDWLLHAKNTTVYNIAFNDDVNYRKKIFRKELYGNLIINALEQSKTKQFIFTDQELYLVPCDINFCNGSLYDKPPKYDYGFKYNITLISSPDEIPKQWYERYSSFVKKYVESSNS